MNLSCLIRRKSGNVLFIFDVLPPINAIMTIKGVSFMAKNIYSLNSKNTDVSLSLVSAYITTTERHYYNHFNAYAAKNKPEKDNFIGIIHTVSGNGIIRTVNHVHNLNAGDLVIIKHNEIVSFESRQEEWHFYCIWFYLRGLKLECDKVTRVPELNGERERYIDIIDRLNGDSTFSVIKANALCLSLVMDYIECIGFVEKPVPYKAKLDETIKFIHDNVESPVTVEQLANRCGFCKNHFCNLFKKYTEITPKQYIINTKLKKSVFLLLNSSLSVEEIADKLSFFSQSYYISCFKKHYRITPAQFRKNKTLASFLIDEN